MTASTAKAGNGRAKAPQEPAGERANGAPTATPAPPAPEATFPVDSFREAAPHLRRPFTPQAVKFKVQSAWPKEQPDSALIVCYIDARLVIERLNLVCPHLWHEGGKDPVAEPPYQAASGGLLCRLTVDGITRADVGEGQGKGLVSDALKRAGVHFGVGVSLYATPKIILSKRRDGAALKDKRTSKGPTLELTDAGERLCRERYAAWLNEHGVKAFGQPLDHGDAEDAVGDAEVEAAEAARHEQQTQAQPPARQRQQQPQPEQPPAEPQPDPAEKLAELLAAATKPEGLQKKRRAANAGMEKLGAGPAQRLKELQTAGDERALDALIVRISNALDQSAGGGDK